MWPFVRAALWSMLTATGLAVFLWQRRAASEQAVRYSVPVLQVPKDKVYLEKATIGEAGSTMIQCYAPATGQLLGHVKAATAEEIDEAVAAAKRAQQTWAKTTFGQRRQVLRTLLQHVLDHQSEICRIACVDSGKLAVDAALGEVLVVAERLRWTILHGEAALRPSRRPTHALLMPHKRNTVIYEPLGVVAALVSWNYPFHNLVAPMVSALFAGNGVVVKASEQTAWSAQYFTSLARGALVAHGFDAGLIQTVVCWPAIAGRLTGHPDIAHVTFIGSQAVARHVAADAAAALTPLCAELGGKDPFIVLDSVGAGRLPSVAATLLRGTFQASGQNCIGVERVIATPGVYEPLLALVVDKVRALRLGTREGDGSNDSDDDKNDADDADDHYDMGAMISDASFERLERLVDEAVASGARLLAGGRRYQHPRFPHGHYFQPTLLADVTPAMAVAREECFGPVLVLMRAEASTAAAVLAVANAANFGLGASVFGDELRDRELAAVVAGVKAGMVAINDFATYYAVQLPFGGVAGSGFGRFAAAEGLQAISNPKSICEDRFGWLGLRTALPPVVQYPVPSQRRAWAFVQGLVDFGYGQTIGRKVNGLVQLARNA
ncbi:oxidoreductase [Grosmannia clavigera kw1407]|uniref:aldehyde dehydrogenase (NAD(+)) n=1 Tax=Grosmannia clavigera (strain kw1407 / UAMH 11150) TaxID=655863 RepID=F0XT74_GROCL|nr:oxidoreductase [Grosmannia clavigera kw1407]EFW99381.1 oxidoreductase [Grosmannia clavigera kw1407]